MINWYDLREVTTFLWSPCGCGTITSDNKPIRSLLERLTILDHANAYHYTRPQRVLRSRLMVVVARTIREPPKYVCLVYLKTFACNLKFQI